MTEQPPPAVAAGWYEHIDHPGMERFWDGAQWTAHMRRLGDVPALQGTNSHAAVRGVDPAAGPGPEREIKTEPRPVEHEQVDVRLGNERVRVLTASEKALLASAGVPADSRPGWYVDPIGGGPDARASARFWNGTQWTGRTVLTAARPSVRQIPSDDVARPATPSQAGHRDTGARRIGVVPMDERPLSVAAVLACFLFWTGWGVIALIVGFVVTGKTGNRRGREWAWVALGLTIVFWVVVILAVASHEQSGTSY